MRGGVRDEILGKENWRGRLFEMASMGMNARKSLRMEKRQFLATGFWVFKI